MEFSFTQKKECEMTPLKQDIMQTVKFQKNGLIYKERTVIAKKVIVSLENLALFPPGLVFSPFRELQEQPSVQIPTTVRQC